MQSLYRVSASDLQRFLETAEELLRESEQIQIAVATFPETPRSLLAVLVNSDYSAVVEAASLHVNFAGEIAGDYREIVAEVLRNRDLGQNDRLAVELIQFAPVAPGFLSEWVPARRLVEGLQNEYMPLRYRLQLLERLAVSEKLEARLVVAESSETPVSLLELLAGDLELAVRLTVESNDNCPSEVVELVKSQHDLAGNWDAEVEQLRELGNSRWSWIRLTVAQNPFAPEDVLMKLATDKLFRVRLGVGKNPNSTSRVLAVLAEESLRLMQVAVVEHPNIGEETLHQLFAGYKSEIEKRNDLPVSILERFYREEAWRKPWEYSPIWHLLLNQSNTPTWILAELANVDLEEVRADIIATHSEVDLKTLNKKISYEIKYLENIAKHPQVSTEILERLVDYPNIKLKLAVARNEKIPNTLRMRLLEELLNNREQDIIEVIAKDFNTPVAILEQIADKLSPSNQMSKTLTKFMRASSKNRFNENELENLLNKIRDFIATYQSPELILFWLQQDPGLSKPILEDWNQLLVSLNDSEIQALQELAKILSGFGFVGGFSQKDRGWLGSELFKPDGTFTPNYILYGLLIYIKPAFVGDRQHRAIAASLIRNPNIPLWLRETLVNQFTEPPDSEGHYKYDSDIRLALASNPQISEAERINYLQEIISKNPDYARRIAKDAQTPANVLEQLLERGNCKEEIARNSATPEYLLRRIADEHKYWEVLARNPNTPVDLLFRFIREKLNKESYSNNVSMSFWVLENRGLSVLQRYRLLLEKENVEFTVKAHKLIVERTNNYDILERIVETGEQEAKVIIARKHETPITILERLVKDSDEIRKAVVRNPNCPSHCLMELAQNSTQDIQYLIASRNYSTPRDVLLKLLESKNTSIFAGMAGNIHTPSDILASLAENEQRDIRIKALSNANIPREVLSEALLDEANHKDITNILRRKADYRESISVVALEWLVENSSESSFLRAIARNPNITPDILTNLSVNESSEVRETVASQQNCPSEVLETLAFDSAVEVKQKVATNQNTPNYILENFAQSEDSTIRTAVASNPNLSPTTLEQLANDEKVEVRREVACNPNTPEIIRQSLQYLISPPQTPDITPTLQSLSRIYNPDTDDLLILLAEYAQSNNGFVRFITLLHPVTPGETLIQAANSASWLERYAVAENESTSSEIRSRLARDGNRIVRAAANNNL